MKIKVFTLVLLFSMLSVFPVSAKTLELQGDKKFETTVKKEESSSDDIKSLTQHITSLSKAVNEYKPDEYEPISEAYPYKNTVKMNDGLGNGFRDGYAYSTIHTQGDEDFFSVYLTKNVRYVAALKNIYKHDRDIIIRYKDSSGKWWHYKKPQPI